MAPRFLEVTSPLEAAAKSEAAAFFLSFNASKWLDEFQTSANLTRNTTDELRRVGRALQQTGTEVSVGHYVVLGAALLWVLREVLVRLSVRRALQKRLHVD
jgi:hypothetical protein